MTTVSSQSLSSSIQSLKTAGFFNFAISHVDKNLESHFDVGCFGAYVADLNLNYPIFSYIKLDVKDYADLDKLKDVFIPIDSVLCWLKSLPAPTSIEICVEDKGNFSNVTFKDTNTQDYLLIDAYAGDVSRTWTNVVPDKNFVLLMSPKEFDYIVKRSICIPLGEGREQFSGVGLWADEDSKLVKSASTDAKVAYINQNVLSVYDIRTNEPVATLQILYRHAVYMNKLFKKYTKTSNSIVIKAQFDENDFGMVSLTLGDSIFYIRYVPFKYDIFETITKFDAISKIKFDTNEVLDALKHFKTCFKPTKRDPNKIVFIPVDENKMILRYVAERGRIERTVSVQIDDMEKFDECIKNKRLSGTTNLAIANIRKENPDFQYKYRYTFDLMFLNNIISKIEEREFIAEFNYEFKSVLYGISTLDDLSEVVPSKDRYLIMPIEGGINAHD